MRREDSMFRLELEDLCRLKGVEGRLGIVGEVQCGIGKNTEDHGRI